MAVVIYYSRSDLRCVVLFYYGGIFWVDVNLPQTSFELQNRGLGRGAENRKISDRG